ncbi:MAG: hypothetical protein IKC53_11875 [Lentisphaeria bacterium]|nr:hypothetical protein [Lentisphaeria bacterium]
MTKLYSYFTDAALFAILTVIGIVVSLVLFILLYRNRKQDRMTRRRFLLPLALMLIHTLLPPLAFMLESDILSLPWFFLVPVLLIVQILYLVHFQKWDNHDLRVATAAFAFYNVFLFFLTFLAFLVMAFH